MRAAILFLLTISLACAQQEISSQSGVSPIWDVKTYMSELSAQVNRFQPILDKVQPHEWVSKGAPDAYAAQLKSAKDELEYLTEATGKLARDPERLTVALETLFRMQSLEAMLGSLREGIQRYQDSALANQLVAVLTDNANHREKLRRHIVDVAEIRDQEYKVMDQEAQRCRALLSRQPERMRKKAK